jgi:hypothetical protein
MYVLDILTLELVKVLRNDSVALAIGLLEEFKDFTNVFNME